MCHIHPQYGSSQNSSSTTNLSDKTVGLGTDRISSSNDELFDRPSTSAGIIDLSSSEHGNESQRSPLLSVPTPHISISPTEACIKPCCSVEQSDEKFHPNICNGSSDKGDTSAEPSGLENESNNSGSTKIKGAIQTV